jgi:hypothetical protein
LQCQEEMERVHEVRAPEPVGGWDEAAVVAGWVAVDSERVENVYALIVVIEQLTRQVPPATRLSAPNAGHQ